MNTMFEKLDQLATENGSDFSSKKFRVRCLAHIINLSCKQLLTKAEKLAFNTESDDETTDDDHGSHGTGVLKKIRCAIAAIRASPQRLRAYETSCTKENLPVRALLRDVPTRWNSTYDMLVRATEMKLPFERTLNSIKELEKYVLDTTEWDFLDQVIVNLKPFKEATIKISGDRPTLSDTTSTYQILFEHLEKYIDNENSAEGCASSSKRPRRNLTVHSSNSYPDWLVQAATAAWEKLKDYYASSDALVYNLATGVYSGNSSMSYPISIFSKILESIVLKSSLIFNSIGPKIQA